MSESELKRMVDMLRGKQRELRLEAPRIDDIAVERVPDEIDAIQFAMEREMAVGGLERRTALSHEVDAALKRIAQGTYGRCEGCGGAISLGRMLVVPWASLCIRCQEEEDSSQGGRWYRERGRVLDDAA
jgi:DnaK suppressor protein